MCVDRRRSGEVHEAVATQLDGAPAMRTHTLVVVAGGRP